MIRPYTAACVQSNVRMVRSPTERDEVIQENLHRSLEIAEEAIIRDDAKLIVFPEFWLQGFEYDRSVDDWIKVSLRIPGQETDQLADFAAKHQVYLAGAAFEYDPDWPDRFFNCGFIVSPEGKVILKYRKIQEGHVDGLINATSPGDVYAQYVQRYGEDALFPVVETPLGKLGVLLAREIITFEVARCLTLRGAEVLLHPTGEPWSAQATAWEQARRSRAYENLAYLLSANHGSVSQGRPPMFRSRGHSEIIDYNGKMLAVAEGLGESLLTATLNINALRHRRTEGRQNFPAQLKTALFAPSYRRARATPNDHWADQPIQDRREGAQLTQQVIRDLQKRGVFARPAHHPTGEE